ncbi:MAG: hypothetical protein ABIR76_10645, partial [Polaromonas sp.]
MKATPGAPAAARSSLPPQRAGMRAASGRYPSAAPWRVLAALAVAVLGAHALVLKSSPLRFGPAPDAASQRSQTFV